MRGWKFLTGDVNWEDHGGMWCRQSPDGAWWVVRFENCSDWGDGATGYECSVLRVSIPEVPAEEIHAALRSCGWEVCLTQMAIVAPYSGDIIAKVGSPAFDLVLLDALIGYGTYSPMGSETRESRPTRVRAAGRRLAESMMVNTEETAAALAKPVNALGATAADFGRGDPLAPLREKADAILRGEDPEISITDSLILRMYGASNGVTLGTAKEAKLAAAGNSLKEKEDGGGDQDTSA